ncbi:ribbon-helix-helix domain-containing protein [Oceanobacillus sp. FSL W7-1293]|uniref:CopG family ribbon-helix-helix protein n=1 Tax=Oceanobacillus sp. FSL W7-1293 TaxID=2921699 RepID=UPI0030D58B95
MKQKGLTIRLDEELLNEFDKVIKENSVNKSALIRNWIEKYIRENQKGDER